MLNLALCGENAGESGELHDGLACSILLSFIMLFFDPSVFVHDDPRGILAGGILAGGYSRGYEEVHTERSPDSVIRTGFHRAIDAGDDSGVIPRNARYKDAGCSCCAIFCDMNYCSV